MGGSGCVEMQLAQGNFSGIGDPKIYTLTYKLQNLLLLGGPVKQPGSLYWAPTTQGRSCLLYNKVPGTIHPET